MATPAKEHLVALEKPKNQYGEGCVFGKRIDKSAVKCRTSVKRERRLYVHRNLL